MENLAKAIISVMNDVAGIEKSLTVGTGNSSYKGVSDKDVKKIIGNAMAKHGLCIMPIEIEAKTQVDRWEEVDPYSNAVPKAMKTKQSVFVETTCKYLLLHTSGESQVISGYGNGVDSQDKAAGKATTYSMKNALLYTFMIPTGEIDDADKTHSDEHPVPPVAKPAPEPKTVHPELVPGTDRWLKCKEAIATKQATLALILKKNTITEVNQALLLREAKILEEENDKISNPNL